MGPKLRQASHKDGGQKIPGLRLASTHFWRKQQDEVPVFSWVPEVSYGTFVLFKDTHWWESDSAWVCGSRRNSAQMERMPRGCSYDATSILKSGLFAGGRESKEGRQTIFFTPLKPFGDISDEEEPRDDLSKPRKVHYHSKWKSRQDAVYWSRSAVPANQISCRDCMRQCAGRLHLQSDFSKKGKELSLKDSRRLVPHRR